MKCYLFLPDILWRIMEFGEYAGGKKCAICKGRGVIKLLNSECTFCNGTGEYTESAETYMKSHICQCALFDRKQCPVCGKKCHHDTPNRPKILLSPSWCTYMVLGQTWDLSIIPCKILAFNYILVKCGCNYVMAVVVSVRLSASLASSFFVCDQVIIESRYK